MPVVASNSGQARREFRAKIQSSYGTHTVFRFALSTEDCIRQIERDNVWRNGTGWSVLEVVPAYPDLPPAKPAHLTWEECLRRYPRLCLLIQDVLIGSRSEAACCLRDYRDGFRYGSEAWPS